MKFNLVAASFAVFGTAFSQQIFRCMCVDSTSDPGRVGLTGIENLCKSKGGEAERPDLCIKSRSRFTDAECNGVKQGATGICIEDTISNPNGASTVAVPRALPTP
ncbi:hypothetical protein Cob_v001658 [Colletotrichum orbiculare MAFF 240422]|uniref:Uncharacterized protein n=1 Tax=Colletotrichum orbiculare (strain 104-T / ATCC 96160 / CBS 514.97 / LARS 414 / MAFF 240422) TaxID=1213857 RepID=N4UW25_COLOR|nr:hypothetical protein Cob_v001658 [Colletotrichum orbiculare MAFF 240422]